MANLRLDDVLSEFHNRFGYKLIEKNNKLKYLKFERIVEEGDVHVVIIEDHRWELSMPGFNPKTDIGDWLIFSILCDEDAEYCPLTYSEYKIIEKIIYELETDAWEEQV